MFVLHVCVVKRGRKKKMKNRRRKWETQWREDKESWAEPWQLNMFSVDDLPTCIMEEQALSVKIK